MRRFLLALTLLSTTAVANAVDGVDSRSIDGLRTSFPAGSIDSKTRADAALAATAGAKAQVEKDDKAAARNCLKAILVNDCLDKLRGVERRRMGDIDAVELEANRFKRQAHADEVDAARKLRETERQTKAPADEAQRARNRDSYDARQAQAQRDAADRVRSAATHAASKPHRPVVKVSQTPADVAAAQRAKNVVDYDAKVKQTSEHRAEITRRLASKAADRKHRADAKAAKDAKEAASTPAPAASPPVAGPKP